MPKSDFLILLFIFSVLLLPVISCGDDEPVKLSKVDNQYIDSVFFAKKDSINKLSDSLCLDIYPGLLKSAVDSIKSVRRKEIEFILGK